MISLKHYRYFVSVVDAGSFTQASAISHISRQTLSSAVHELEKTYNNKIFVQESNALQLTAFGKFLYERCKKLLYEFDELQYESMRFSETNYSIDLHHELLVVCPELKSCVLSYIGGHSGELLEFVEYYDPEDTIRKIMNQEVDCGFILSMSNAIPNCWSISIKQLAVYAVVHQNHPLAECEKITLDQVLNVPIICFGRLEVFYKQLHEKRVKNKSDNPIIIEPNTLKASQFMKNDSSAIMLIAANLEAASKYKNIRVIPVVDVTWNLQLVGNKKSKKADECQRFGETIRGMIEKL